MVINKKLFFKGNFYKHFVESREKIGFSDYDKNLCNYLCERVSMGSKLLEIAVGNGYPFADYFQKKGYKVCGLDISPDLIAECQRLNQNIDCKVGDAEKLDYPDNYFDCVYCFHSTFYFPNLNEAIDEMIRVARPGGFVLFDIQNRNNESIKKAFKKQLRENSFLSVIVRYMKNFVKIIFRIGYPIWPTGVYEVPACPESICKHLVAKWGGVINFNVMVKKEGQPSIEERRELGSFEDFHRLVFVVKKL